MIDMTTEDTNLQDDANSIEVIEEIVEEGELNAEEIVARAVLYAFDQGTELLEQAGEFEPFTIIVSGEELFVEEHPGETEEESYESARRTVYQMERLSDAYAFCYDGYVDLDDGVSDAIIVEYARKGDEVAAAVVKLYHRHDEHFHFDEELYQVGDADSLYSPAPAEGTEPSEPSEPTSDEATNPAETDDEA
jgi:hypothetical protein